MKSCQITLKRIEKYVRYLREEERSQSTIQQYRREVMRFYQWLSQNETIDKETALLYKEELQKKKKASSVNAALAALNGFFRFMGCAELQLKPIRIQRKIFCEENRELSYAEYLRLVETAETRNNERMSLILQTIAGTGIRVSELQAITVEAVRLRRAEVHCKSKWRSVLLPGKLCRKLLRYIQKNRLSAGPVFVTRTGRPVDRSNIWAEMKKLCAAANVDPHKVFPHNLRHLFARRHYNAYRDIIKLADILGHSNVNTTRIYTISTGREHTIQIEELGFVI